MSTVIAISGSVNGLRDVLEFTNQAAFPIKGHRRKIYVDLEANTIFRWDKVSGVYIALGGGSGGTQTLQEILNAASGTPVNGDFGEGSFTIECTDGDAGEVATLDLSFDGVSISSTTRGGTEFVKFLADSRGAAIIGIKEYVDDTAAIAGGLSAGYIYRTGNAIKIVL